MLVLTRKPGQKIIVTVPAGCAEQTIEITIGDYHRGKTPIGVEASHEIKIDREEVYLSKSQAARNN